MKYELPEVVKEYCKRIRAEILNFRRAMVKEYHAESIYYTEKYIITFHEDGTVTCNNPELLPTPEEAKSIAIALQNCGFPKSVHASEASCARCPAEGTVHQFWNLERTGIIMIQSRPEGKKRFIPWVLMSDHGWAPMEPDGLLPFWKPKEKFIPPFGQPYMIMMHEGAKTASAAEEIARDDNNRHPWKPYLSKFEHWGMIGGALAPHRSDYSELKKANASMVVYVCDNDDPGLSVPKKFSKLYGKAMKVIRFTSEFRLHWDMADELPEVFFENGRYNGKPLESFMQPGTWSTIHVTPKEDEDSDSKKGKGVYIISDDFANEWYHTIKPSAFIHKDWPTRVYTETEFNNLVDPFSHIHTTGSALRKHFGSKSAQLKYNPAIDPGIYPSADEGLFINTFSPCSILPERGNAQPFIEFMEYLVPSKPDRFEIMKWCATLIACPAIKMLYGILAISETQGVGKTTLGSHILAPLVGEGNVSYPSEKEVVESQFNSWLAHKRLAVVNEIYAGNSSKAYNKLKEIITDTHIDVNKKYQDVYTVDNYIHIFACSNSRRALKITPGDRRWFVPEIVEFKKPTAYWEKLYFWLKFEGGLSIIRQWAIDFVKEHGHVDRGAEAPNSVTKFSMVNENYSPGMMIVQRSLQCLRQKIESGEYPEDAFTTDRHLQDRIKNELYEGRHNDKIERTNTIRNVAKEEGWCISSDKIDGIYWGPTLLNAFVISMNPLDKKPGDLGGPKVPLAERRKPVDLNQLLDVL